MDGVSVKRALISVFDKSGIEDFARALADMGVEIISSGGTAKAIEARGIKVRYVQEWTGFPEMLGHRVVTLHPKVHGGILALRDDPSHQEDMKKYGIEPIDLVCVGLYPFENVVARPDCTLAEAVEMIDIGGPTMVRAAAKNHRFVGIVTDKSQYSLVLDEMRANSGKLSDDLRARLARQAFAYTAHYDSAISSHLAGRLGEEFPERLTFSYRKSADLRYGENPHQKAAFYVGADASEACVARARLLGGKEISYNNYFDANGALELVKDFAPPAVAIIKHANPAGCAIDDDLVEAYRKAYLGDVNAAMGGIIAVNRPVTADLASAIVESYKRWGKAAGASFFKLDVWIAPGFDDDAVDLITTPTEKRKWGASCRLLAVGDMSAPPDPNDLDYRKIAGGMLVQTRDLLGLNEDEWKVVTQRAPSESEMSDLRFAWLVCKHTKSNAISICRDGMLLGNGAGQMSRVKSCDVAIQLAHENGHGDKLAGAVAAGDAFFPVPDGPAKLIAAGITAMIQPGGGKRDAETIAACDQAGVAMILTGTRHFKH